MINDLATLRQKIDALDTELLRLLNERAEYAKEIGAIKNRQSLPIYSPDREMKLLSSLVKRSQGPLRPEAIRAIYREIMSASIALEKDIAIACMGPMGSPSHHLSLQKFGSSVRYSFHSTIPEVFDTVTSKHADCGVVPLQDSAQRFNDKSLDALAETNLLICNEISTGIDKRHIVIGHQSNAPTEMDRTLFMLRVENQSENLARALDLIEKEPPAFTHFATRPSLKNAEEVFVFIQADGHKSEIQDSDLFISLATHCQEIKILGSYPKSPF